MLTKEDFEFDTKLNDGRLVYVQGFAMVLHNCDCLEHTHPHIDSIEFEQVLQLFDSGSLEGQEIESDEETMMQIETIAEHKVYHDLELESA